MKKLINVCVGAEQQYDPRLFKDLYPNTELGQDVKLLTRKPGRLPIGESLPGFLTRDSDTHMTFEESVMAEPAKEKTKRYPKPYDGILLSLTQRDDETLRSHFKDFVILPTLTDREVRRLANKIKNEFITGYQAFREKRDAE